jgi:hypothetical protein
MTVNALSHYLRSSQQQFSRPSLPLTYSKAALTSSLLSLLSSKLLINEQQQPSTSFQD